jgi:hypothetical protein
MEKGYSNDVQPPEYPQNQEDHPNGYEHQRVDLARFIYRPSPFLMLAAMVAQEP